MTKRLAGIILIVLLSLAAIVGWFYMVLRVLVLADDKSKGMLAGLDTFGNVSLFGGSRFESISSQTGRELGNKTRWAVILNGFLNLIQKGHCKGANELEQPLLDYIEKFTG
jgi:predicted permease